MDENIFVDSLSAVWFSQLGRKCGNLKVSWVWNMSFLGKLDDSVRILGVGIKKQPHDSPQMIWRSCKFPCLNFLNSNFNSIENWPGGVNFIIILNQILKESVLIMNFPVVKRVLFLSRKPRKINLIMLLSRNLGLLQN